MQNPIATDSLSLYGLSGFFLPQSVKLSSSNIEVMEEYSGQYDLIIPAITPDLPHITFLNGTSYISKILKKHLALCPIAIKKILLTVCHGLNALNKKI